MERNPNMIAKEAEVHLFERPVPGQSLTNSPEQPYPWETPPEITSVREGTERIFLDLLKDENLVSITDMMAQGTPIDDVASMLLVTGFQKGKWNPDMMLQLMEPTMYMLLAIAEKTGINPVIDGPDDNEPEEDDEYEAEQVLQTSKDAKNFVGKGGRFQDVVVQNINPASVGGNIQKKLEELDLSKTRESILQKKRPEMQKEQSLLGKTGV